ncbi:TrmB family transcriptional regulator [Bhargavaea ginsengi]|uniref:TrmB family transcriptional regulator n=1 Tax=Bhargavaea ginsengi TaxID=426757 RepID=UPI003C72D9BB
MTANVLATLKKYGFTEYEAKIYLALLQRHPMNGNEIAKQSGVPSPKVYETLKRMNERTVVFSVSDGSSSNKKLYSPLPYEELLSVMEAEFEEDTALLNGYFQSLSTNLDVDWSELYHITGYAASLDTLRELIAGADSNIYISGWTAELSQLEGELREAHARGVKIVSISFDPIPAPVPWHHYKHHEGPFSDRRHVGELSCAIDDERVFILHSATGEAHSVISSHAALVRTTVNYIRHDIYVNQVVSDFHEELAAKYGEQFEKLLDRF